MTSDSSDLKHGSGQRYLNQRYESYGGHDRRGRVHHDAQRTMIRVTAFLVAMRNLRDSQQRQQDQTHHGDDRPGTWPSVESSA